MKVAIMQPYFFPYIGYWQLIANSDQFIFFDVVQYNKRSWMNRNRILHPNESKEFQYLSVPIKKHSKGTLIKDIEINNDELWKLKIIGQMTVYKKLNAPYYKDVKELIDTIFSQTYKSFLDLCIASTVQICKYLDIWFSYKIASKINFDRSMIEGPGDWALAISKELQANQYINPFGGFQIFDEAKYSHHNIDLKFIKPRFVSYKQSLRKDFIAGLSILDILMFNSKHKVQEMLLYDYELLTKERLENRNLGKSNE